jgi:surfeit locus 1 family protein
VSGAAAAVAPRPRWTALVPPAIVTLVVAAGLVGLGIWQLQRLAWKEALIRTVAERTVAPPTPLPPRADWAGLRPDAYEYRHVAAAGTFDHAEEVHVYRPLVSARGPYHGLGDIVLTPFHLAAGGTVIVNRGFVPNEKLDPAARTAGQVAGPVTITGLMRSPQERNGFTPADDTARNQWFTADPVAIAGFHHIVDAAPFVIDEDAGQAPGGLPQGGETVLDFPNSHLQYALTWFGLAAALLGVFGVWADRQLKGR